MNTGEKIDRLFELREQKDALTQQVSDLNKEIDAIEYAIIQDMENSGLESTKSTKGAVYKKVELYPQVKDISAFVNWIVINGKYDMIQKRVSAASFNEHFTSTGEYPDGVETFNKTSLNVRRAK